MTIVGFDRITVDPKQMNGQPCIRGMRLTVRRVVEAVSIYSDRAEIYREYPELHEDDVRQALEFAAANLEEVIDFRVVWLLLVCGDVAALPPARKNTVFFLHSQES